MTECCKSLFWCCKSEPADPQTSTSRSTSQLPEEQNDPSSQSVSRLLENPQEPLSIYSESVYGSTTTFPELSTGNVGITGARSPTTPLDVQRVPSLRTQPSVSSGISERPTTPLKTKSRLERSFQRFNKCVHDFQTICAGYETAKEDKISRTIFEVLDNDTLADTVDIATALETTIDQMMINEDSVNEELTSGWISSFFTKLYPLVKVVVNGGQHLLKTTLPPSAGAVLIIRASFVIFDTVKKARNYPKDLVSNLESASYQAYRLKSLKGTQPPEGITEKGMDLLTAILQYYVTCLTAYKRGLWGNVQKDLSEQLESEYESVKKDLQHAISEFNEAILDHVSILIQELYKFGREKHDQELFEWLSPSSSEVIGQLSGNLYRYYGGTLEWLDSLQELNDWLTGEGSSRVLWLTGLPGTGKSVIASTLVAALSTGVTSDDGIVQPSQLSTTLRPIISGAPYPICLAYFFCKSEEYKLRHAYDIIRTFAYQMARQSQIIRQELEKARVDEELSVARSVGVVLLFNRLLQQPIVSLLSDSSAARDILCIIDGLDEAENTHQENKFGYKSDIAILLECLSNIPGVRLLIISRRTAEVSAIMERLSPIEIEITSALNCSDIDVYVGWRVSQSERLRRCFDYLEKDPVKYFRDSASGNFLLTSMKLQVLETTTSYEEFESMLQESTYSKEFYHTIIEHLSSSNGHRKKKFIKEVLKVIIASARELAVTELEALIQEKLQQRYPDFQNDIKSHCGTFLSFVPDAINDPSRFVIQIVHNTFRQYITGDESLNEEFHVSLPNAHGELAMCLLRYLNHFQFPSQLIEGKFTSRSDFIVKITEGRIQKNFPLLRYAVSEWSNNLRYSSHDPSITQQLCKDVVMFLTQGPLLIWIEAISILNEMPVLRRTMKDITIWMNNQLNSSSPADDDMKVIKDWIRDLDRLCQEYSDLIYRRPNSIHSIPFDLFPNSNSLLYKRYRRGIVSVSGGYALPLNPAINGVSNICNDEYDISAFSPGPRQLFGLANTHHIRVIGQEFETAINIISAPGPSQNNRWAVLAMAFTGSNLPRKNFFAAVHAALSGTYSPELSVWDLDTRQCVANIALVSPELGKKCLIDWMHFSQDQGKIHCGVWQYDLPSQSITIQITERVYSTSESATGVITLSPDYKWTVSFESDGRRVLSGGQKNTNIEFNRPPFYAYDEDDPAKLPAFMLGSKRHQVARFRWLQWWRESTRSYKFSNDSRWFARFTDDNCIILHDLRNDGNGKLIYRPEELWTSITANNIVFDAGSGRLAWTFNHVRKNVDDARVEIWDTRTEKSLGGFQLGRSCWRERIDFGWESSQMITYRTGITMWEIPLALKLESTDSEDEHHESDNWVVERYVKSQYSIRLQYSPDGRLYLFLPLLKGTKTIASPGPPSNTIVVQGFDREKNVALKTSFDSSLLRQRLSIEKNPKWGFQWDTDGRVLSIGTTIINIGTTDRIYVSEDISVFPTHTIIETAFHISASMMACLQRSAANALLLQLYSTSERRILSSTTLKDDCANNPRLTARPFTPALIVFDPEDDPKYLVLLISQPDEFEEEGDTTKGPVQLWVFDLPSLIQTKNFRMQGAGWISDTMVYACFARSARKFICCESRKVHDYCRIWIIDLEKEKHAWQSISNCRHLVFLPSKELFVIMRTEGLVEYKPLSDMESDIQKHGNHRRNADSDEPWVNHGWTPLIYLPSSFIPCYESEMAAHEKGEISYVSEFGKRLIQHSFDW